MKVPNYVPLQHSNVMQYVAHEHGDESQLSLHTLPAPVALFAKYTT